MYNLKSEAKPSQKKRKRVKEGKTREEKRYVIAQGLMG